GFFVLAPTLGPFAAAAMTLLICSVANNAANRRLTFAFTGRTRRFHHFARGLMVALLPLAATMAVLGVLSLLGWTATLPAVVALTVVSCAVGIVRFVLLQRWVFGSAGGVDHHVDHHVDTAPTTEYPPPERDGTSATDELADAGVTDRAWWLRVLHGPEDDPDWARPALFALIVATGVMYIWGLGASGWANSFYSAAVQAGTKSWKAFFFGSSDASNFITVDKPPASLWAMELSARVFGVNSWAILIPQALEGVAAVGLLYAAVRRWFSPAAGLIAGVVLATTPVAALMFRFNNPDALLVLVLVGSAYAL